MLQVGQCYGNVNLVSIKAENWNQRGLSIKLAAMIKAEQPR